MSEHHERQQTQSGLAGRLFAEASKAYPASVTAQATYIAQYCISHTEKPLELLNAIQIDDQVVSKLLVAANSAHKIANVSGPEVNEMSIRRILRAVYEFAEELMVLDDNQLTDILTRYSKYKDLKGVVQDNPEHMYRMETVKLIQFKKPNTLKANLLKKLFSSKSNS